MKKSALFRTVAAVGLSLALTTGCAQFDNTTEMVYNASDGIRAELDQSVVANNLLVVTEGQGEPGWLIGSLANNGKHDVEVQFFFETEESVTITVPAGEHVLLGAQRDQPVEIAEVTVAPGSLLPSLLANVTDVAVAELHLPVLDGTLAEYRAELDASQNS